MFVNNLKSFYEFFVNFLDKFSIFKQIFAFFVIRKNFFDKLIKIHPVVFINYMSKFVNNNVIDSLLRILHQTPGITN